MVLGDKFVITEDGSPTLWDPDYGEHHHSMIGAYTEARYKFIETAKTVIQTHPKINLLDLPFGLGYNFVALAEYIETNSLDNTVHCIGIEKDQSVLDMVEHYPQTHPLSKHFQQIDNILKKKPQKLINGSSLDIIVYDLLHTLPQLNVDYKKHFHLIFYDPFSPRSAPHLWSKTEVLQYLVDMLSQDGLFITYSASNKVRKALQELGCYIAPTPAVGRKMPGTIASKSESIISSFPDFTSETLDKITKAKPYN